MQKLKDETTHSDVGLGRYKYLLYMFILCGSGNPRKNMG